MIRSLFKRSRNIFDRNDTITFLRSIFFFAICHANQSLGRSIYKLYISSIDPSPCVHARAMHASRSRAACMIIHLFLIFITLIINDRCTFFIIYCMPANSRAFMFCMCTCMRACMHSYMDNCFSAKAFMSHASTHAKEV